MSSSATYTLPVTYSPCPFGNSPLAGLSDNDLIEITRSGSSEAFAVLFQRHRASALRFAFFCTKDPHATQDLVAEAFVRVLQALKSGGGPNASFRGYLMTVLRNVVSEFGKLAGHQVAVPDISVYEVEYTDSAGNEALKCYEHSLVMEALHSLSERWRTVLWYTVIQGEQPAALADHLGISPNGVAALTYRAKEGLRQAYLTAHLNQKTKTTRCTYYVTRFAAYSRGKLGRHGTQEMHRHLELCEPCRTLQTEVKDLNTLLRN